MGVYAESWEAVADCPISHRLIVFVALVVCAEECSDIFNLFMTYEKDNHVRIQHRYSGCLRICTG